jgi:hypothetical protein
MTILKMVIISIKYIITIISVEHNIVFQAGWNLSVPEYYTSSTTRNQFSTESILGKLPVVPVGDTGTIPHRLRNRFEGAPGDRREGSGDGCRMWFVNSWAFGWSRDM